MQSIITTPVEKAFGFLNLEKIGVTTFQQTHTLVISNK
jgi:hypothetical protein